MLDVEEWFVFLWLEKFGVFGVLFFFSFTRLAVGGWGDEARGFFLNKFDGDGFSFVIVLGFCHFS
mgnify:CR=1 FL=1